MNRDRLIEYIGKNRWILSALLFFIVWKFFLVWVLWHGRFLPPEPDDSYNYVSNIAAVTECPWFHLCSYNEITMQNSSGYAYLSYRLFFGLLGKLLHLSADQIYHAGFYIGTVLLALCLVPFLKIFTRDQKLIAWAILFLSFYHGLGEIHGFYWVVPSFFSVLLFFVLCSYVLRPDFRLSWWTVVLLTVFYTFAHPMSVFLIFILPVYICLALPFRIRVEKTTWRRTFGIVAVVLGAALLSSYAASRSQSDPNAYNVQGTLVQAHASVQSALTPSSSNAPTIHPDGFLSQKLKLFDSIYFRWVIARGIFLIPFLVAFAILIYRKEYVLLIFYLATLLFFLAATLLNPLGFRSAIVLWPVTYILFAWSSWHLFEIIHAHFSGTLQRTLSVSLSILIGLALAVSALFAVVYNYNLSVRHDIYVNPALRAFLLEQIPPDATIGLPPELISTELARNPTLHTRYRYPSLLPDYLILTDTSQISTPVRPAPILAIDELVRRLGIAGRHETPPKVEFNKPEGYVLEKVFGTFEVYKKTS